MLPGILLAGLLLSDAVVPRAAAAAPADAAAAPDPLYDDVDAETAIAEIPDPIEPVNRVTFAVNRKFDAWVIDPFTRAYRFVVPAPLRRALRRALMNLDAPVTMVNDVLQLEPRDAAVTVGRFVVNTTIGLAGFLDVAGEFEGFEGHESDFGQTLALSGVPTGPYLVLPILGPSNARDATGYMVDFLFRPTSYIFTPGGAIFLTGFAEQSGEALFTTILESSAELAEGLATREAAGEAMAALEASSVDYYAALRNAYHQNRTALVWRRGPDHGPLARAKRAYALTGLGASRGEVVDLPADGRDEGGEAVALER
jgi:phospholipid-binding lipoprotein MlaA